MTDVRLRVNGKEYAGWKTARVTRGIESVAGSFTLTVSDRWAAESASWPIREGDACELLIGREVLVTGYVDSRRLSFDASTHGVEVSGRDRTGELVDCSADLKTWEFHNAPVLTLAQTLARPFGVAVVLQPGTTLPAPVAKLSADPGDTVYEVIERACRTAALLAVADGRGGMELMRPGAKRAADALVEGANLLSGSADYDATGRFRRYVVRGQHSGTDALSGAPAAAVQATAEDANEQRTARVLLVRPEGNVTRENAKIRAEWEATVRAARAVTATVRVQGWTQSTGAVWPVNALVHVASPKLEIDGEMLITQATYSLDDSSGTVTELTLRPPNAFKPEPVIPKKVKKGTVVL